MNQGTIRYEDESHKFMDVQAFVNTFPELRIGLEILNDHFGDFTEMTLTIAGMEYSFVKTPNQPIPEVDFQVRAETHNL